MTISGHMLRMAAAANQGEPIPTEPGTPYGGGFYFGDITVGTDVWALIIADRSTEVRDRAWKTTNTDSPGTTSANDGWANTNAMNNASHPAALYCRTYAGGGFYDWYLWSLEEARVAHTNIRPGASSTPAIFKPGGAQALGDIITTRDYWTSTQNSPAYGTVFRADSASFSTFPDAKSNTAYCSRPIRRVKRN